MKGKRAAAADLNAVIIDKLVELNEHITSVDEHGRMQALNQPHAVTIKRPNGRYSKAALIGGEKFTLVGMYRGKRGDAIAIYKPITPIDGCEYMEMKAKDAMEKMDGFATFIESRIESVESAIEEMKKKAEERIETQMKAYGGHYGSW